MKTRLVTVKRLLGIILMICCITILSGCIGNHRMPFASLEKRFLQDYNVIDTAVINKEYDAAASLSWIERVDEKDGCIDFYCGGSGIGSQTNYTGFFFTRDDDPLAMWRDRKTDSLQYVMTASDYVETANGWEYRECDHNAGGDNVLS